MVSANNPEKTGEDVYADSNVVNTFTLEDARYLKKPTDKILCTLADNKYISFGEYSVVDFDSKTKLFAVDRDRNLLMDRLAR